MFLHPEAYIAIYSAVRGHAAVHEDIITPRVCPPRTDTQAHRVAICYWDLLLGGLRLHSSLKAKAAQSHVDCGVPLALTQHGMAST
jgi:hypothetical protein